MVSTTRKTIRQLLISYGTSRSDLYCVICATPPLVSRRYRELKTFQGRFFVILGDSHPSWLPMAHHSRHDLKDNPEDLAHLLEGSGARGFRSAPRLEKLLQGGANEVSEAELRLMDFLLQNPADERVWQPRGTFREALSARFREYWLALRPWERVFLRALSAVFCAESCASSRCKRIGSERVLPF